MASTDLESLKKQSSSTDFEKNKDYYLYMTSSLSREELVELVVGLGNARAKAFDEACKLKAAIKEHHDQKGDDRCWLDDLALYKKAGLDTGNTTLPPKAEFLSNCERYWNCRQDPTHKYKTVKELRQEARKEALDEFTVWLLKTHNLLIDNALLEQFTKEPE